MTARQESTITIMATPPINIQTVSALTTLTTEPAGILALLETEAVKIHHPHRLLLKFHLNPNKKIFHYGAGF